MTASAERSRARTALLVVLAVLFLGSIVEGAAYFVQKALEEQGVVYRPRTSENDAARLDDLDPVLGWPSRGSMGGGRDASGSRVVPAFPDPAQDACVSVYGDSFTWAAEVADDDAWGNLLAQNLRCRVSNFGVPAYGTDQAYLRFKGNAADRARVVLLGHMSENIERNVNQYRPFIYPSREIGLKPRFILDSAGALELVPLPALSADEYARMVRRPAEYLPHEELLPGSEWGPTWARLPHTLTIFASLTSRRVHAFLRGKAYWNDFYGPDHPAHALDVTEAILASFVADARRQGRQPVVVVFPTIRDLATHGRGEPWTFQLLLDDLQARGLAPFNVGDRLLERLPGGDAAAIASASGYHYNAVGNHLVAEIIGRYLVENGLAPPAPGGDAARE